MNMDLKRAMPKRLAQDFAPSNDIPVSRKTLAVCSKRSQRLGARKIDERRRTCLVRWSEAIERNDAYESFSADCYAIM
jgi:hypothetical protein